MTENHDYDDLSARLTNAILSRREANEECAHLALLVLAFAARRTWPEAAYISLSTTDQDYSGELGEGEVYDRNLEPLGDWSKTEIDEVACALDDTNALYWYPFMLVITAGRFEAADKVRAKTHTGEYLLDIAKVLAGR